jgi:hypothetical protein
MKVECPQCHKIWILPQGTPDLECDCHLICEDGDKQSDCSPTGGTAVTYPYNWSGSYGFPEGLNAKHSDNADQRYRATGYCTTHDNYIYTQKIVIPLDWNQWYGRRAPTRLRMSHGEY